MPTVAENLTQSANGLNAASDIVRQSVTRLQPYVPGKPIEEVKRELGLPDDLEIIKLASNENVLGPSPLAIEAMQNVARDVWLYPDDLCFDLKKALAARWNVGEDQLIVGNGSDEIIHFLALALLEKSDEVILADPSFVQYKAAAMLADCAFHLVPMQDDLRHDLRAMKAQVNPNTKLIFIANPNNPTGTVVSKAEFDELLDGLPPRVVVVLDQAYYEYVTDSDTPEGLDYVRAGHNVVVLHTFSKAYAIAGLRVGYGISTPQLAGYLQQVRGPFNVNSLAQAAAIASLKDDAQVEKARECNSAGLEQLYRAFDELGLRYWRSEANFVLFDVARDAKSVGLELMKRGIIVRSAIASPTWIRVTVGTREMNERFISSLREVLSA